MKSIDRYPVKVFWSEDDCGFIAVAPDLPGCSAFGETKLEALDGVQHAMAAWIEAAEKARNPIPEPSRAQDESAYSGRLLLRLPKSAHARLAAEADAEGISLNQHICVVLAMHLGARSVTTSAGTAYQTIVAGTPMQLADTRFSAIMIATQVPHNSPFIMQYNEVIEHG